MQGTSKLEAARQQWRRRLWQERAGTLGEVKGYVRSGREGHGKTRRPMGGISNKLK